MDILEILLVEDNPGDVRLTQEALRESKIHYHLTVASDGIQALDMLASSTRTVRPNVILLDLNLPGKNGLEILDDLKADNDLKEIPIIVLTSSENDLDVLVAYKKQASAYLVKPATLSQFDEVINAIVTLCAL